MKNKKIRATFYYIPCYYSFENNELEGRNWICDKLIEVATGFHQLCNFLFDLDYSFPIKLKTEDLSEEELKKVKNN